MSRALPALAAAVLALTLSACAPAAPKADPGSPSPTPSTATCTADSGVTVIVDGGNLPGADEVALDEGHVRERRGRLIVGDDQDDVRPGWSLAAPGESQ